LYEGQTEKKECYPRHETLLPKRTKKKGKGGVQRIGDGVAHRITAPQKGSQKRGTSLVVFQRQRQYGCYLGAFGPQKPEKKGVE